MTDRHHAGDDADIPGLDDVQEDAAPADPEAADELLEGLLGAQAAKRDDVPVTDDVEAGSNDAEHCPEDVTEDTPTGRWACRLCETKRRSPDGVAAHHLTCPDSKHHREEVGTIGPLIS